MMISPITQIKKYVGYYLGNRKEVTLPDFTEVQRKALIDDIKAKYPVEKKAVHDRLFPDKIRVVNYENGGSIIRIEDWEVDGTRVLTHNHRGKACDLGNAQPVSLVVEGKACLAYQIDGDHGVGLKLSFEEALLKITNSAEEAWAYLESAKFARVFTDELTGKQKAMFFIFGCIIGQVIFFLFHV